MGYSKDISKYPKTLGLPPFYYNVRIQDTPRYGGVILKYTNEVNSNYGIEKGQKYGEGILNAQALYEHGIINKKEFNKRSKPIFTTNHGFVIPPYYKRKVNVHIEAYDLVKNLNCEDITTEEEFWDLVEYMDIYI